MRIGINATILGKNPSGLGIYTLELLKSLYLLHKDLLIYTSVEIPNLNKIQIQKIFAFVRPENRPLGHLFRLIWCQTFLPVYLRKDKITVVLNTVPEGSIYSNIPQVTVVHDLLPLYFPQEYPKQKYYFKYFVPKVVKRSKKIIAVSENTKRDIVKFYGIEEKKIVTIYNGYDDELFRPIKQNFSQPYFLYVGNLHPHKNVAGLIRGFARIKNKIHHNLIIAGQKDMRFFPSLNQLAIALDIDSRIFFMDYIELEKLPLLYSSADAFVSTTFYEGFGLPQLEAMACGCPVITSKTSSLPEVCGDACYYIENPLNDEEIANALLEVANNSELRKHLTTEGLKQAKKFSWKKTSEEIFQLLKEV